MGHQNTKKHKAQHGNYYNKPSKKNVKALMDLYAGVFQEKNVEGKQLSIKFD